MAVTNQWAGCAVCGVPVLDRPAHARLHALLGDAVRSLLAEVTTRDPATGEPDVPNLDPAEADALASFAAKRDLARVALKNNGAYLALNPPTQAQAIAQVAALTRQVNALIRLALYDHSPEV